MAYPHEDYSNSHLLGLLIDKSDLSGFISSEVESEPAVDSDQDLDEYSSLPSAFNGRYDPGAMENGQGYLMEIFPAFDYPIPQPNYDGLASVDTVG
jgi:hypothetical protein